MATITKICLKCINLSWRRSVSYKNQSIDLQSKSINWFLYDMNLYHERVKRTLVCQKPRGVFSTPSNTQDGVFLQSFIAYLIQGRECVYEKPIYKKPGTRRTKNLMNFYCFILQLQEIFKVLDFAWSQHLLGKTRILSNSRSKLPYFWYLPKMCCDFRKGVTNSNWPLMFIILRW